MAKKTTKRSTSKAKSQGSPLTRLLLYLVVLAGILIAVFVFGVEPEEIEKFLNGETTSETTDTTTPTDNTTVNEVEPVPVGGDWYELYFTQVINTEDESQHHGAVVEQALIRAIDGTQNTIDMAVFELNAPDTTAALLRALERGVKVRIVGDDEHNIEDPESTIEEVIAAGAEVISDERSALMHNKFFIFDGSSIWTGSMNITRNGMYNNNNNAIWIQSPQLARNYQNEFDEMFIDKVFNRRDDSRPVANPIVDIDGTQIETFFSPEQGDEIEARLEELSANAQTSIRIMSFSFTLEPIGAAMIDRFNAGVTVEGVIETTGSLQGQMGPLACAGANFRQDGNPDILHHKVMIFDEEIVVMGSLNFSASARDNNNENILIIHNPTIAQAYTAEWQKRFDEGRVPSAEDLDC